MKMLKYLAVPAQTPLQSAIIKLFVMMMAANIAKGGLYLYDAYDNHLGEGAGRAARLIVSSIVILFIVRKFPKLVKAFLHYGILATIVHIYYRVFSTQVGSDVIAIQAIIMVLISSFYGLGRRWGVVYSSLACTAVLSASVVDYRLDGLKALPQDLNMCYIAINWIVIIVSHLYFHSILFDLLSSTQQRNDELSELARAKSNFLSTMSHELRTPLNSVIGIAELLREQHRNDEQRKQIEVLLFSANGLLSLINDVLDINKLDAGKLELEKTNFSLLKLTNGIAASMQAKAKEKNIFFRLEIINILEDEIYNSDPTRISQILNNLTGNAVKFTSKGGVTLKVSKKSKKGGYAEILFEVIDTGIGIDPEQQEQIFQPFQQAMAQTTRKYGGTGLGLTIVRELLELFDSRVKVVSAPQMGTTMSFTLNLEQVEEPSRENIADTSKETDFSKLKVLLAEDNKINIFFMRQLFKRWQISADYADNGREALEMLQRNNYDLILMDMYMPEMDGISATKAIRKLEDRRKANIYIIALTASVSGTLQDKVMRAGINDYLQKPFQLNELALKLNTAQNKIDNMN
jgi:signal transduction histidine kinase/ActR/RegA family two-component response regulator